MFEKFSEESIKVIMFAQEEAQILKHQVLGCEHLLLGLFASNADCIPPEFLSSHSFNLVRLREAVEKILGTGPKKSPRNMPFSDDARFALIKAYERAAHMVIRPKHILLALFDFPDLDRSVAMKVFVELKIDPNELRIPVIYRTHFQETPDVADGSIMSQQEALELCRGCSKVVLLAQEEARRLKHNSLGTEMLLLGLAGAGGTAAQALEKFGITLEVARAEVEKIIGQGCEIVMVDLPFTPRAKKLLGHALEEAQKMGHNSLTAMHLLLGLTYEQDGVAWQVLKAKKADLEELRQAALALFGDR